MNRAIDTEAIGRLRGYADDKAGVAEEFLPQENARDGLTLILTRPLAEARETAWVVCPALGKERTYLRRLESMAARTLASSGFRVLRIRGGTENAQAERRELSFDSRLEEVEAAVSIAKADPAVRRVGLVGAMFGGTIAALMCERLELDLMALWEPELRGRAFLKDAFRRQVLAALVAAPETTENGSAPPARRSAAQELADQGWTTIRGFRITQDVHDRIASIDLTKDLGRFRGDALVLGASTTGEPGREIVELGAHLEKLGADVTMKAVEDPLLVPFGDWYYRDVGLERLDARLELDERLSAATAEWSVTVDDTRAKEVAE